MKSKLAPKTISRIRARRVLLLLPSGSRDRAFVCGACFRGSFVEKAIEFPRGWDTYMMSPHAWETRREDVTRYSILIRTRRVQGRGGQRPSRLCGRHKRIHPKANEGRVQPRARARTAAPPVARRHPPSPRLSSPASTMWFVTILWLDNRVFLCPSI